MSCKFCIDDNGDPCFPCYGLGPHTHEFDENGIHTILDEIQEVPGFTPSIEDFGMGTYWCPHCGDGKP